MMHPLSAGPHRIIIDLIGSRKDVLEVLHSLEQILTLNGHDISQQVLTQTEIVSAVGRRKLYQATIEYTTMNWAETPSWVGISRQFPTVSFRATFRSIPH